MLTGLWQVYCDLPAKTLASTRRSGGLSMRLFIAINFNTDTHVRLIALRDELSLHAQQGKFSLDANLHLTLAFLGECDIKQTSAAKSVMDAISFKPFNVAVEHVGRFKRDGGDIWWAGLRATKPLMNLQSTLTERLREAGFVLESRKYSPHITLG